MEVSHIDMERMIPDRKSIVSTLQARSLRFYFETIRVLSPPSLFLSLSLLLSFYFHLYIISESLSEGILSSPLLYLHRFAKIILSQLVSRWDGNKWYKTYFSVQVGSLVRLKTMHGDDYLHDDQWFQLFTIPKCHRTRLCFMLQTCLFKRMFLSRLASSTRRY